MCVVSPWWWHQRPLFPRTVLTHAPFPSTHTMMPRIHPSLCVIIADGRTPSDLSRGMACLRQMERYRPSRAELTEAIELVATLKKFKKAAKDRRIQYCCNRIYKYWRALASGKDARLPPLPPALIPKARGAASSGGKVRQSTSSHNPLKLGTSKKSGNRLMPGSSPSSSKSRARSASPVRLFA